MSTTIEEFNLFDDAVEAKPAAKKEKARDTLTLEGQTIKQWAEQKKIAENAAGKQKLLEDTIKTFGRQQWIEKCMKDKAKPSNFKVKDDSGTECLIIMQDKYKALTPEKAAIVPENAIESETVYSFNNEILSKYEKLIVSAISKAIMTIDEIPMEEKKKLLVKKVEKTIKKGTIDRLNSFENPEMMFSIIEPICQLKNA